MLKGWMPDVPEAASPDAEILSLAPGLVHHTPSQYFIVFTAEENKSCAHIYFVFFVNKKWILFKNMMTLITV